MFLDVCEFCVEWAALIEGDLFKALPDKRKFDIVYFNPPFHKEGSNFNNKLMHAFLTGGIETGVIGRFLNGVGEHLADGGTILVGFSNKDQEMLNFLESGFAKAGFEWEMPIWENRSTVADNRIYTLKKRKVSVNLKIS